MGRLLLEGDGGASLFELSLRLLGGLLVGALEDGARSTIDDSLGLTEAEAGESAHLLDDLDLLVTGGLEDDVEGILLLDLFHGGGSTGTGRSNGDGGGGGDLEGLLELLHELAQFDERELLERVEQLVSRQLCHDSLLSVCGYSPLAKVLCGPCSRRNYAADSCFSRSASTVRTACDSGALNRYAAPNSESLKAPASLASSTSRDSRSASLPTSSAVSGLPSK